MLCDDILHHRDESSTVTTIALEVFELASQSNSLGVLLCVD